MITRKDFLKKSTDDWQTLASVQRKESWRRYMLEGAQELKSLIRSKRLPSLSSPPRDRRERSPTEDSVPLTAEAPSALNRHHP